MTTKTYTVIFNNNRGSFAVDSLAATVQGSWHGSVDNYDGQGNDLAHIEVDEENAEYLESLLNEDENVVSYRER